MSRSITVSNEIEVAVIIASGSSDIADVSMEFGVASYVGRPLDVERLLNAVNVLAIRS